MFQVHQIPAFKDNYLWLIQPDTLSPDCYIVDPGAAEPLDAYLQKNQLEPKAILLTHHHHDHIDGADEISTKYQVPIYGPKSDRIPQVTDYLNDGDIIDLSPLKARVLALPGHTLDHIAYFIEPPENPPMLFSGDTIFAGGCGRLFDGTAALLYASLQKIAALPDTTQIYAAHEYTLSNLQFALHIEPDNKALQERYVMEKRKRDVGVATLPTSLELEKQTNPFLRCHLGSIQSSIQHHTDDLPDTTVDFFTKLRLLKDNF